MDYDSTIVVLTPLYLQLGCHPKTGTKMEPTGQKEKRKANGAKGGEGDGTSRWKWK